MARLTASEHGEQKALIEWATLHQSKYPDLRYLFAIPNQGAGRNKRLQLEGCKPGVPDLCLPVGRGRYHGLFIELKREGGRASFEQLQWIEALRALGYSALICIGWEQARDMIVEYLMMKKASQTNAKPNH